MSYKTNTREEYMRLYRELDYIRRHEWKSEKEMEKYINTVKEQFRSQLKYLEHNTSLEAVMEDFKVGDDYYVYPERIKQQLIVELAPFSEDVIEQVNDIDMYEILHEMSEVDRQVIRLLDDKYKQHEIAKILGVSNVAVSQRIQRIRKKMAPIRDKYFLISRIKAMKGETL